MAVPRPVIIAVLGVALIAGVFVMMRGSQNTNTVTPAPSAPATHPQPAQSAKRVAPAPAAKPHPARPAQAAQPHPAAAAVAGPLGAVVSALQSGRTVVLYFSQSSAGVGTSDDAATHLAVDSVAGMPGVSVFNARLSDLSTYRPLLSGVAVSQVPAVVVMRGGKARLVEGFVDPGTLRQTVADERG